MRRPPCNAPQNLIMSKARIEDSVPGILKDCAIVQHRPGCWPRNDARYNIICIRPGRLPSTCDPAIVNDRRATTGERHSTYTITCTRKKNRIRLLSAINVGHWMSPSADQKSQTEACHLLTSRIYVIEGRNSKLSVRRDATPEACNLLTTTVVIWRALPATAINRSKHVHAYGFKKK